MSKQREKRIVIIGSAGVGKTTLLKGLQNKVKLKVIPELARIVCRELGYKNIYEIEDPNKFRIETLKKQIKLEEKYKSFISDRSTVDCWVHWMRWSWGRAKTYESEKYFKFTYNQALKYSHIIYIPRIGNIKAKNDGFRWNNEEYQNQMDRLFKECLLEWQLMHRTCIVEKERKKERIKEVLKFLNS